MIPLFFIFLFLLVCGSAYAFRSMETVRRVAVGSASVIGTTIFVCALLGLFFPSVFALEGFWHVDALSYLLITVVSFLYVTASLVSFRYIGHEFHEGVLSASQVRLFSCLLPLFILTMLVSLISDNLGVLWIGLEGTTLATTMLVALYRKDASIEAAWKYIILCSIGISIGLLGMLMFVYAGVHGAGLEPFEALSLRALREHATGFDPALVAWAFAFVFIGLGTKVGFVPMHTWLPDAHSKTPSPVSALLSGVLLNVALYAILRFKFLTDLTFTSHFWSDRFFLVFGVLSVTVSALILVQQGNYKRLLAYSSIEHMGLMAVMIGLGPVGLALALLHTVSHALIKSLLFFGAGEIFLAYQTTKIQHVTGVMQRLPKTAVLFLLGLLLILAVPPSALFLSEFAMIGSLILLHPWLSALLLVDLSVIAWSMLSSVIGMWYGAASHTKSPEAWNLTHTVMATHLSLVIVLGVVVLTEPAMNFFTKIAQTF